MILMVGHGSWTLTVYSLFAALVASIVVLATGPIAVLRDRTGLPPPEGRPFRPYSATTVASYLHSAGVDGPRLYRRALLQDIPFLLLYGAGFVLLIDGTLGRVFSDPTNHWRFVLDGIGAAAALFDAVEDGLLAAAVGPAEVARPSLVPFASVATTLKWLFVLASTAAILTGAILLAFRGTASFGGPVGFLQIADERRVTYSTNPSDCHAVPGPRPDLSRPDLRCTPGSVDPAVTQATIKRTICQAGWTRTIRPPSSQTVKAKSYMYRAYNISPQQTSELDHLIPLELGGSNDITNLWIEVGRIPNAKDAVENRLRRSVCGGRLTLRAARTAIVAN